VVVFQITGIPEEPKFPQGRNRKMKKYWLLIGLVLVSQLLSACGEGSAGTAQINTQAQTGDAAPPGAQSDNADFEMPVSLKLALGTLKLDRSPNEVSAAEAAALLPLWKAVRSLGSSETVAAEEIEALYGQIQETMSADQIAAMDQMDLTQTSMAEIAEELGIELLPAGGRFDNLTPEQQATAQAARESGQFPQGGFPLPEGGVVGGGPGSGPGGGAGFGGAVQGGGNLTPELQATMTARREANSGRINIGVPTALLDALIQYLESKSG
jgi:hypothetical protein